MLFQFTRALSQGFVVEDAHFDERSAKRKGEVGSKVVPTAGAPDEVEESEAEQEKEVTDVSGE